MEEKKFVCKYCSKRYPCGKSLGGHIRTHMMSENSLQAKEEKRINANANVNAMFKFDDGRKRKRLDLGSSGSGSGSGGGGGGDDGNLIYGLRENPKKTSRFVHSNVATIQMEKFCKECGKGFPSLKALCGHMACHSEKDKGTNRIESVSGVTEKHKLVMDSQSDTEASVPTDTRRSKRMKFKNLNGGDNSHPPSSSSLHWGNCSSSVSEVEQEQEDVARCLMMLSRDATYKGTRFAMVTESSDNNSVVLEAKSKSPSVDTKFAAMKNIVGGTKNNGFEFPEKKLNKDAKMKSVEIGYVSDNSDSGYFTYGPRKVESDDSSDAFFMNNDVKSSKAVLISGFEDHDFDSRKKIMSSEKRNRNNNEFKKLALDDSRKRQNFVESSSKKKAKNGTYNNDENYESLKIERESFSEDSAYESDENSTDSDSYPAPPKTQSNRNINAKTKKLTSKGKKKMKSKKSKEHECPICNKIFRSGQALGGHKRSHFVGGNIDENTFVIRPANSGAVQAAPAANPCLIDLNLPAPDDE
ncbi:dentin sialophosphoprotein-like [Trifolium pratense]|uniref:dentin sialophosphoprotein-like n=1 Tax=Trifolium pratense TaxID=57577 RepID=UPI001E691977|nr:dentin sialophosphoprotein-like [Trifolium pratense]